MNSKDISTNNEKESSSDEQKDYPPTSYCINKFQKILLDIDEKPDIIIEKILINIFNRYISPDINEIDSFQQYLPKKIKILCIKHQKYQIIYYLLTKIRSLIKKYREKIFELPNIIELQEKTFQKSYSRSNSYTKIISDDYINFRENRVTIKHQSIPKKKRIFDYYITVKNLFCELRNIKNCLEKTAPLIEKIFEIPLSEFEKFSIYECEKEDYLNIFNFLLICLVFLMSSKDISTNNEKESSSDEQKDYPPTSYCINKFQKILLDIDEKPDIIIEKILINIFNRYISPDINETDSFQQYLPNKIKLLCKKHQKYQIIYYLLTKIRSLIKKYREKIFELPNIIELQEKIFQKSYNRSNSHTKKISEDYINFGEDRVTISHKSYPKKKRIFDYYITIKNLFCELRNIKNCLEKTAPLIEKIFEIPLSEFEKFSIYECEKEDYLNILIHDNFIWKEIIKNRNTQLSSIIKEITEDDNKNLTLMTNKIEYFKQFQEYKKLKIDEMLKIAEIGSSKDNRFPEDARPIPEPEYYQSNEDADIDEYLNIEEEQNIQNNENINNINNVFIFNKIKENYINNINTIKIKENNKYIDILKNNNEIINNEDNYDSTPNIHTEINNTIINKNLNNIIDKNKQNKKKSLKNKEKVTLKNKKDIKKENNNENNNKFKKSNKDKKEIPSDIDDLVKYIVNDDKTETQNKKRKKNKKRIKKIKMK